MSFAEDRIQYTDVMDLNPPVSKQQIKAWENKYGRKIPEEYADFLMKFNGGEIYVPGIVLFGVEPVDAWCSLTEHNCSEFRKELDEDYLIIGKKNYGNPICIYTGEEQTEETCMIVEWELETQEPFQYWNSLEDLFQAEREIFVGRKSRWKRNQNTDM